MWVLTSSGNGFVTVKNVVSGLYLTDAGQLQQRNADKRR